MTIIYRQSGLSLPKKRIKTQIERGRITEEIRSLLKQELVEVESVAPNSWDVKFMKNMIGYSRKLTEPQKSHLTRILQNYILDEEYPNGIEL